MPFDNDEEGEMESFGLTDADLEGSDRRRKHRGMSKEQAMLGIWAEDDDNESDGGRHLSKKVKGSWVTSSGGKDSSGDYAGSDARSSLYKRRGDSSDDGSDDNEDDEGSDKNDDEDDGLAPKGLGFSSFGQTKAQQSFYGRGGLGSGSGGASARKGNEPSQPSSSSSSSSRRKEFAGLGSSASSRQQHRGGRSSKSSKNDSGSEEIAAWEQHTKGFGSKMLKKFGYVEGTGLGAKGEGLAVPIEVKLRPGKTLGLGVVSELTEQQRDEEKRRAKLRADKQHDAESGESGEESSKPRRRGTTAVAGKEEEEEEEDEISAARSMLQQEMEFYEKDDRTDGAKKAQRQHQQRQPHWKKTAASSSSSSSGGKSAAPALKTVSQVIAMSKLQRPDPQAAKQVIMDFTQREARVLTSLSDLHQAASASNRASTASSAVGSPMGELDTAEPLPSSTMPELQFNLRLLVELSEADIQSCFQKIQLEETHLTRLRQEEETVAAAADEEQEIMDRLKEVSEILAKCHEKVTADMKTDELATSQLVLDVFQLLRSRFPDEYKAFDLASLALSYALPIVERLLGTWKVFHMDGDDSSRGDSVSLLPPSDPSSPSFGTTLVFEWKQLLNQPPPRSEHDENVAKLFDNHRRVQESSAATTTPYDRLMWDVWVPYIRGALVEWSPRRSPRGVSERIVAVLTSWSHLLPDWIGENICEQLLLPRLVEDVEHWNPVLDPTPIHSWVFPLIPLLGISRLAVVFPTIKYKLLVALTEWHPSDFSAHAVLSPWKTVLPPSEFANLLARSVAPKLAQGIRDIVINPAHQEGLEPIAWLVGWMDVFGNCLDLLAGVLDRELFPKWHYVLDAWLSSEPDFEEVSKWYLGWKALFPQPLLSHQLVALHFTRALTAMNKHLDPSFEGETSDSQSAPSHPTSRAVLKPAPAPATAATPASESSFKAILEKLAEDKGLLFMPAPSGKRVDGNTVYLFGSVPVYVDRAVVFAQRGTLWMPVSLDKLASLASTS